LSTSPNTENCKVTRWNLLTLQFSILLRWNLLKIEIYFIFLDCSPNFLRMFRLAFCSSLSLASCLASRQVSKDRSRSKNHPHLWWTIQSKKETTFISEWIKIVLSYFFDKWYFLFFATFNVILFSLRRSNKSWNTWKPTKNLNCPMVGPGF